ncbi:hypothetical protein [Bremerella volcania]|nr:hypothetical protein [Bremerella volcania]
MLNSVRIDTLSPGVDTSIHIKFEAGEPVLERVRGRLRGNAWATKCYGGPPLLRRLAARKPAYLA